MSWWRAVRKKGNKAEILVLGDIGASWWASVNTQQIRKELAEFDDVEEITLRIDSPGGSVFAGIGLYSYLKDHKAKKKVYIDGMCLSFSKCTRNSQGRNAEDPDFEPRVSKLFCFLQHGGFKPYILPVSYD